MIVIRNVLVATDLGPASRATLDCARSIADALSARLHVVHVVDDLSADVSMAPGVVPNLGRLQMELEADARRQLDRIAGDRKGDVTTAVLTARRPAVALLAYARDEHIDLIVAGTHTRTEVVDLFMGSVAQALVRRADCPVLTVRHREAPARTARTSPEAA